MSEVGDKGLHAWKTPILCPFYHWLQAKKKRETAKMTYYGYISWHKTVF